MCGYTDCDHDVDDVKVKFLENGHHTFTLMMCPICVTEANENDTIVEECEFIIQDDGK